MKTIIVLALCLLACDEQTRKELAPTASEEANKIVYYRDSRTGLCYAASFVGEYPFGTATVFSNVPCSPEVEKLLAK